MTDDAHEFNFEVPAEMDRVRADKVLHAQMPDLSRSRVQTLFELGLVWRDDDALEKSDKVYAGDVISYEIPDLKPAKLRPVDIPLKVLFEDEHMIAIDKAPGMVVHPGAGTGEDTLVHALLFHCKGGLSGIGGEERPGIVHRLDKETSGVIVAAKSDPAFLALTKAFSERRTHKCYLALVAGCPTHQGGTIDAPIGRHTANRQKMCIRDDGRSAVSDWEVAERFGSVATLVRVVIHTGRTHQVRVHMSHIGLPLAGDELYGWHENKWPKEVKVPRILLHAWQLEIPHPATHEPLALEAPVPQDFEDVLAALRTYCGAKK
jgi:23S rRNA pseudouridine1911/1915/1917 synthase